MTAAKKRIYTKKMSETSAAEYRAERESHERYAAQRLTRGNVAVRTGKMITEEDMVKTRGKAGKK